VAKKNDGQSYGWGDEKNNMVMESGKIKKTVKESVKAKNMVMVMPK